MEEASAGRSPRVTIRYFEGCPHWRTAHERVLQALREAGLEVVVPTLELIGTPEEAETAHFVGSPTVLIDGRDPFDPGQGSFGLTCRVYQTPDGLAGSPTVEQLRRALRST